MDYPLTERDIECKVERMVDRLDARFMRDNSSMTEEEYKTAMKAIDTWAEQQYAAIS